MPSGTPRPDGHIDISIGSENGAAVFAVSDDGTGIEPDQLGRIFDRFHRTDEGRSRAEGGSGLGLAIARAIVEAHGGSIAAESPPGDGATIRFSIPGYRPRLGGDLLAGLGVDQRDRLRRAGARGVDQLASGPEPTSRATSSTSNASGASSAQSP